MSVHSIKRDPRRISTFMAIVFGAASIGVILNSPPQFVGLGIEFAGILVIFLGMETRRAGHGLVGVLLLFVGLGAAMVGIAVATLQAPSVGARTEVIPGLVGFVVLSTGAIEAGKQGYGRALLIAGTGLLVISVLVSGVLLGSSQVLLLVATAAAIVAWDVGEQGINLGQQVGRGARSWRVEVVHALGAMVVGLTAIGVAFGFRAIDIGRLSITGLVLLLGASITLIVALYN